MSNHTNTMTADSGVSGCSRCHRPPADPARPATLGPGQSCACDISFDEPHAPGAWVCTYPDGRSVAMKARYLDPMITAELAVAEATGTSWRDCTDPIYTGCRWRRVGGTA